MARGWLEHEVNSDGPFALADVAVAAGPRHWSILRDLLLRADPRANLVPDGHLAAIAIEHGATVATRARGFARFPGVRWIDPLAEADPG